MHIKHIVNDGAKRKASECMLYATGEMNFCTAMNTIDMMIDNYNIHSNLYKQPPVRSKIEK